MKFCFYFFWLIVMIFSHNLYAQDLLTDVIQGGNIWYLDQQITTDQLFNFKKNDLRILRNTIYAKYGYQFNSPDLRTHFSQFPWYIANKDSVASEFSALDWKNINVIADYENSFKEIIISEKYEIDPDSLLLSHHYHFSASYNIFFNRNFPKKDYIRNKPCWYFRPPYSNNTIPVLTENENFYIYDIKKDTFTEINDGIYWSLFLDNDRGGTFYVIYSPEWTLSNISGMYKHLYLIDKNSIELFPTQNSIWSSEDNTNKILDYLLKEFKNTVFDNAYFLDIINTVNKTDYNIITRYGAYLNFGDHEFSWLLSKLDIYFKTNIYAEFMPSVHWKTSNANIYDNGFYFYNKNMIVFFDIRTNQVTKYKFDKPLDREDSYAYVSQDMKTLYIRLQDYGEADKLYKYDM